MKQLISYIVNANLYEKPWKYILVKSFFNNPKKLVRVVKLNNKKCWKIMFKINLKIHFNFNIIKWLTDLNCKCYLSYFKIKKKKKN